MMNNQVAEMKNHIESLLEDNDIFCDWRDNTNGRAWRLRRTIRIKRIRSEITYCIALHEIGHIVSQYKKKRIESEAEAWLWAKENAIVWTPKMAKLAAKCMRSYLLWANLHKTAWVPGEDHISRQIAEWE